MKNWLIIQYLVSWIYFSDEVGSPAWQAACQNDIYSIVDHLVLSLPHL